MVIQIKGEDLFMHMVREYGTGKVFYSVSSSGISVGDKPAPKQEYTYLCLTPVGSFVYQATTDRNDPDSPLDFEGGVLKGTDSILLPADRIILK